MIELRLGDLEATVALAGAELQGLRWRGQELLWDGDPAWWSRRAPLLFPIVARLQDDELRVDGRSYTLPQHGFARDLPWKPLEQAPSSCLLGLRDDAGTRACFPFAFELQQRVTLVSGGLELVWTLANPGPGPLIASLGAHPAFRWPLPGGQRDQHVLEFEIEEPEPVRRLAGGLLRAEPETSPVEGRRLFLHDELFQTGALIFDRLRSRRARYSAPGSPKLELAWDFPHFAVWTKPGAPFLCLEPWQGFSDPEAFRGDFSAKPGTVTLQEGAARSWTFSIRVSEALP